eukprot:CAMPEP_0118966420 /NCGR_PEP_ID=MMETSP1173-20130426/3892_1 /TAXON_ID=1034831 /ORGANISM="Rhizochromulina marina cf, Strain CCMP1243" /LENGTH=246 /DNA_ID=CAMNT_0006915197 /DNA_START=13 /DNA_END=753 /DNA_ORIENTATION=-
MAGVGPGAQGGGIIGAGAGGGLGLNAPGAGPKVRHFAAASTKGVQLPPDLEAVWEDIISGKDMNWVMMQYDDAGKALSVTATGEGGLSEFKAHLDESLAWGGFRCTAVDDRQNTTSRRPKFVFVQYMPSTAPAMRRAKMGSHKGTLKAVMHSAHLDMMVETPDELTETDLVARLQAATGAHKPNGYEFDPGVTTSAEGFLNGMSAEMETALGQPGAWNENAPPRTPRELPLVPPEPRLKLKHIRGT